MNDEQSRRQPRCFGRGLGCRLRLVGMTDRAAAVADAFVVVEPTPAAEAEAERAIGSVDSLTPFIAREV